MFNAKDCNSYDGSNIKKLNHRTNSFTCTLITNVSNRLYGLISFTLEQAQRGLLRFLRFPQENLPYFVPRQDSLLLCVV